MIIKNFIDKIIYKDKKITVQLKMLDRADFNGAGNPVPDIYAQKIIVLEVA